MANEDWHKYTLHSHGSSHHHPTNDTRPATTASPQHSPPQRYESLGLLLLQSGGSPSFFGADEESCHRGSPAADERGREDATVPRRRGRHGLRYDAPCAVAGGSLALGALGALLGLVAFPPAAPATPWDAASHVLGYTYCLAWTLSFYPQILTNWRHPAAARRGVSLDFVAWNVVGFACYAIYTTSFRYSGAVRREYAARFGGGVNSSDGDAGAVPQVEVNDVAFAWHALILTVITFAQIAWWSGRDSPRDAHAEDTGNEGWVVLDQRREEQGGGACANSTTSGVTVEDAFVGSNFNQHVATTVVPEPGTEHLVPPPQRQRRKRERTPTPHWTARISSTTKCLILLLLFLCIAGAISVACTNISIGYWGGQWIDYLYFLSFVKVGVSIVKYIPQVVLNYQRKSTAGWQIWNILLDFSGGALSIVQLVGDSAAAGRAQGLPRSWTTGIAGNPAKLGLGLVSVFFDVIFMFQHYILYRHASSPSRDHSRSEHDALRSNRDYESPLLPEE